MEGLKEAMCGRHRTIKNKKGEINKNTAIFKK